MELYSYKIPQAGITNSNLEYLTSRIGTWTVMGEFISLEQLKQIARYTKQVAICLQPWHRVYPPKVKLLAAPHKVVDELDQLRWRLSLLSDQFKSVGLTCPMMMFDCERWDADSENQSYLTTLLDLTTQLVKHFFPDTYVDWANKNYYAAHLPRIQVIDGFNLQLYRNNVDLKDANTRLIKQTPACDTLDKPMSCYIGTGMYYDENGKQVTHIEYPTENTRMLAILIKSRFPWVKRCMFYPAFTTNTPHWKAHFEAFLDGLGM